jgi:hypothetical protein
MRPIELQSPEDRRPLASNQQALICHTRKDPKQLPVPDDPLRQRADELASEVPLPQLPSF